MEMSREQQLLTLIKLQAEIIQDQDAIKKIEASIVQKKALAASLKNFGKLTKTQSYKQAHTKF